MRYEALKIPAAGLSIRRPAERYDAGVTRAQVLHDPFDDTVLARGIPALEKHEDLVVVRDEVSLQLDQLDLQLPQPFLVALFIHRLIRFFWLFVHRVTPRGSVRDLSCPGTRFT
jgi:hypothetical protein